MLTIDNQYRPLLLEAIEDMMYKLSMQLNDMKGQPMGKDRQLLTDKQRMLEELQHQISMQQ